MYYIRIANLKTCRLRNIPRSCYYATIFFPPNIDVGSKGGCEYMYMLKYTTRDWLRNADLSATCKVRYIRACTHTRVGVHRAR